MKLMVVVIASVAGAASAQPSFETIGFLPGAFQISHGHNVSSDGSTVIGTSSQSGSAGAFRWTRSEGLVQIPVLAGSGDYTARGVSPSGNYVVGSFATAAGTSGEFVWSSTSGTVGVGSLPGGRDETVFLSATDSGLVLGLSSIGFTNTGASLNRAVRWTASSGLEALPLPDTGDVNFQSMAFRTINDGRIFGRSESGAWLYSDDSGFEMLDIPDGMNGINSTGTFLSGTTFNPSNGNNTPSYWTSETGEVHLPLLSPTDFGRTLDASDDGSVIVGELGSNKIVWLDQGSPIDIKDFAISLGLDMDGWNITRIGGVSADGSTIVGTANRNDWDLGRNEAFVLKIPAPSSAIMLGASGLYVCRRRR
jgi:uncharacterized membrane protein